MDWVSQNGICTEAAYPYSSGGGSSGSCQNECNAAVTCDGHVSVPGEDGLLSAISKGPVSVGIEADRSAFQLYKSGVLDDEGCGRQIDHGVLAVGYGTSEDGDPHYEDPRNGCRNDEEDIRVDGVGGTICAPRC